MEAQTTRVIPMEDEYYNCILTERNHKKRTFQLFLVLRWRSDDLSTTNGQDFSIDPFKACDVLHALHADEETRTALNYLSVVMGSIDLNQIHRIDEVSNTTLPINK
jgi:hypothetical protein